MKYIHSLIIALIVAFWGSSAALANVHIYASPGGLSPRSALRQAREMRRLHQVAADDTVFIHLADGIYQLDETLCLRPEDSGTPTSPTVLVAQTAGKAILSGGQQMAMRPNKAMLGWWQGEMLQGRRSINVRQLYKDDRKVPHASLCPLDSLIEIVDFRPKEREVWVPVSSFEPIIEVVEAARLGFDDDHETMLRYKRKEIRNLEMLLHQRWAIALLRVKDYRVEGDVVKISFEEPESRLEFEHPWPQPVVRENRGDGKRRTSGFNLLGGFALAQTGTWYQDNETGQVVYAPTAADTRANDLFAYASDAFTVPVLHQLLTVEGTIDRPVHDVLFRGIGFQYAAWTRPSEQGHVTLQGGMYLREAYKLDVPGLPEKDYLENQAWIERPEAAVTVRGAQRVDFEQCEFRHLGATGLDYVWAASDCRVIGCHFEDIGGTALALGHFTDGGVETHVPYAPQDSRELCQDLLIQGNLIENVTNEDWGCVGIGAGYVANTTICDNEVRDVNYSGICVGWGWTPRDSGMRNNHIVRNRVHRFAKMLYDAGGIYTLSNQPGSSIEDNRLWDLCPPTFATNLRGFYIYLDEATDGYTIRNNYCPKATFGDNRPGPAVRWENNGPKAGKK